MRIFLAILLSLLIGDGYSAEPEQDILKGGQSRETVARWVREAVKADLGIAVLKLKASRMVSPTLGDSVMSYKIEEGNTVFKGGQDGEKFDVGSRRILGASDPKRDEVKVIWIGRVWILYSEEAEKLVLATVKEAQPQK